MDKMIQLAIAADRLGVDESRLFDLAAIDQLALAVYADSWVAHRAAEDESGHIDIEPGTQRILNKTWLFVRAGYIPTLARLESNETYSAGKFSSGPGGTVDTWVSPKPAMRKRDLHLRESDLDRLRTLLAQEELTKNAAEGVNPSHHNLAWQERANQIAAAELSRGIAHQRLTRGYVAVLLAKELGEKPETVERRIRKQWRPKSPK